MKILQLISSTGLYGAERLLLELAVGLDGRGSTVVVGAIGSPGRPPAEVIERAQRLSLATIRIPCRGRFDLYTVLWLRRFVKAHRFDVIHSHGYKADFYSILARPRGTRIITTCHNWPGSSVKMQRYRRLDQMLLARFDAVVVVSEVLRSQVVSGGVPDDRVRLIHNGITLAGRVPRESDLARLRRELGIGAAEKVVGAVGRPSEEKGYVHLLTAARSVLARVPETRFVIVGDGPLTDELRAAARAQGIGERVIFTGRRDDVGDLLALMDVFVMPSLTEGLPMALLEAMAAKRPIVASRVGEVPRVLDASSAILIQSGDPAELAAAVTALLTDRERARALAASAFRTVAERFSSEHMTQEYVKLYRGVVEKSRAAPAAVQG